MLVFDHTLCYTVTRVNCVRQNAVLIAYCISSQPANLGSEVKFISSVDLFSRKQHWFRSKRREFTTSSQTTAFCSYEKSYTFREDVSTTFLNAINTDFELRINKLSATVHNKSYLDSRKSAILHNTRKKAHGRTWRWRHSPLKKFWGVKLVSTERYMHKSRIFLHHPIRTKFSRKQSTEGGKSSKNRGN